mmetsp:Transcript_31969/g.95745  ORF Transcript_31969/g.95745 Transcript_31969/m.95745 type:complete len:486 (+) Transcript_31969:292-1749(+)
MYVLAHLVGAVRNVIVPAIRHPPRIPPVLLRYGTVERDAVLHPHLLVILSVDDHDGAPDLGYPIDVGEYVQARQGPGGGEDPHPRREGTVKDETPDVFPPGAQVARRPGSDRLPVQDHLRLVPVAQLPDHVIVHELDVPVRVGLEGNSSGRAVPRVVVHHDVAVEALGQHRLHVAHRPDVRGVPVAVDYGLGPVGPDVRRDAVHQRGDVGARPLLRPHLDGLDGAREARGGREAGIGDEPVRDARGRIGSSAGVAFPGPPAEGLGTLGEGRGGGGVFLFLLLFLFRILLLRRRGRHFRFGGSVLLRYWVFGRLLVPPARRPVFVNGDDFLVRPPAAVGGGMTLFATPLSALLAAVPRVLQLRLTQHLEALHRLLVRLVHVHCFVVFRLVLLIISRIPFILLVFLAFFLPPGFFPNFSPFFNVVAIILLVHLVVLLLPEVVDEALLVVLHDLPVLVDALEFVQRRLRWEERQCPRHGRLGKSRLNP